MYFTKATALVTTLLAAFAPQSLANSAFDEENLVKRADWEVRDYETTSNQDGFQKRGGHGPPAVPPKPAGIRGNPRPRKRSPSRPVPPAVPQKPAGIRRNPRPRKRSPSRPVPPAVPQKPAGIRGNPRPRKRGTNYPRGSKNPVKSAVKVIKGIMDGQGR